VGAGQTFLAIGALFLIGILLLSKSDTQVITQEAVSEGRVAIMAINLANQYIDSAKSLSFSDRTVYQGLSVVTDLESATSLMANNYPTLSGSPMERPNSNCNRDKVLFNDIDDYNYNDTSGAIYTDYIADMEFKTKIHVYYVDLPNTFAKVNTQTWYKRFDIEVNQTPYLKKPIKFSILFSYYNFL